MHPDDISYGEVRNGVLTLSGNGFQINVDGGALRVKDGAYGDYREVRFRRADCGIKRVVITRPDGTISFAAIKWLHGIGAGLIQLDWDGSVLLVNVPLGADYPALRRAQAKAIFNDTALGIMRLVMQRKVQGQSDVLRAMGHRDSAEQLAQWANELRRVADFNRLSSLESQSATIYWSCWESVPLRFARRDARSMPEQWNVFGSRTSPITKSPRRAATPGNAILNYLYGILEAETSIACRTMGLDPGLGFLHTDQPSRDSLALDLMEAARPDVDLWLWYWLQDAHFSKHDFFEESDGTVRLTRALMHHLSAVVSIARTAIARTVEITASILAGKQVPTRLTEARRSAGRRSSRTWDSPARDNAQPAIRTCLECGKAITDRRRQFCSEACRQKHRIEVLGAEIGVSGPAALAELRAAGNDPAHGGSAKEKRVASQKKRHDERVAWETEHGDGEAEREWFVRELQAKLVGIPLSKISEATGFSPRYASLIRSGQYVPHPVHYIALTRITTGRGE